MECRLNFPYSSNVFVEFGMASRLYFFVQINNEVNVYLNVTSICEKPIRTQLKTGGLWQDSNCQLIWLKTEQSTSNFVTHFIGIHPGHSADNVCQPLNRWNFTISQKIMITKWNVVCGGFHVQLDVITQLSHGCLNLRLLKIPAKDDICQVEWNVLIPFFAPERIYCPRPLVEWCWCVFVWQDNALECLATSTIYT